VDPERPGSRDVGPEVVEEDGLLRGGAAEALERVVEENV